MNSDLPQFLILAAPNGGKINIVKTIIATRAFISDPDKELAKIAAKFPNLPAESVSYFFQQYFLDCADNAIKKSAHFVLETNFRDHHLMESVTRFKDSGYHVHLFFPALPDVLLSQDRVRQRADNGGHDVDKESIKFNFEFYFVNVCFEGNLKGCFAEYPSQR